jgi:GNAT superfamily N-acetyltransferase
MPFVSHLYDLPHRETHWSLEILGILPEHQGKGFGRELVEDGFAKAKNDPEGDLPVVVVAAKDKEGFYQRIGFGEIEGWTSQAGGTANPLNRAGVGGGAVLWTK